MSDAENATPIKETERNYGGHPMNPDQELSEESKEKYRKIEEYIQNKLESDGMFYATSGQIGSELGYSAPQIGVYMPRIRMKDNNIHLYKWGGNGRRVKWKISKTNE